jgi:NtrC-family two-component system sensor histidine kinase KinB
MISLRHKLWLGFGGLLFVLLVVSGLSILVFTRFSHTLERVFRENYDSVVYCQGMKEQLDLLDARAQRLIWEPTALPRVNVQGAERKFEQNLHSQFGNISLPQERERTSRLYELWQQFKVAYQQLDQAGVDRAAVYREDLLPRLAELKQSDQQIADMNMNNMVSVNGQVKKTLSEVRNALSVLVVTGVLLSALVVWTAGASMLHPLSALTRSARQIEAGDLELTLAVKSGDEIGLLADAFNSMAARLREFRRLDHERLTRSQQTTQLAIDSLPDAVFVIGPNQQVEIANLAARTHFDIEPGKTVNQLSLRWLPPLYESIALHHKPIEPQGYSSALQLFDHGEERFLLPRATPMLDINHQLIGVTVILVDVTPLRRADEAKSSMVLTVSHELRTPLTGMRMALSLLAGNGFGPVTAKQKSLIDAARDDSERLHRIIENLLNISRLESGRAQLQFRRMNVAELINGAVDPLRPGFGEKNVSLEVNVASPIQDVNADPVSIGSALTNLLSNAMKFTPAGGMVRVTSETDGSVVRVSVTDTGPGIPEQYRDRIFEKFFRVPNPNGPTGAGLGLTIAHEIIEAHGGQLVFDSPDTGGTTFSLALPLLARST